MFYLLVEGIACKKTMLYTDRQIEWLIMKGKLKYTSLWLKKIVFKDLKERNCLILCERFLNLMMDMATDR